MTKAIVSAAIFMAATSCFTGIESTPKITADNVRESGVRITEEQTFAARILPEPTDAWTPGKKWLVDDSKISLTFSSISDNADSIAGHTISYVGARTAPTLTGGDAVELILNSDDGRVFYHRTGIAPNDWKKRASYSIPFTVELSAVMLADSLMRGKTYYISVPRWKDDQGNDIMGQRQIPVKITSVLPGNHLYPLLVGFTQPNRPSEPVRYIPMTYGTDGAATRNFERIFSFENPRKLYPQITDQNWQKIINSQIVEGMTRDECRLALGYPAVIDRGVTYGSTQVERWGYENGVYLIFEDGYLTKFRL